MVVEYLTKFLTGAHLSAAHALRFHRVGPVNPIADIEIVDVLFHDVVAAQPREVIPIAHLVFHFRLLWLTRPHPEWVTVPIKRAC